MFLNIKTIKGHDYAYVVESRREEGRVRQVILRYYGRLEPGQIETLRAALAAGSLPVLGATGGRRRRRSS